MLIPVMLAVCSHRDCPYRVPDTLRRSRAPTCFRRLGRFQNSLERLQDVLGLVILVAGLSVTVSASIGVASLCLGGAAHGSLWWRCWGTRWARWVVAPVLLTWGARPWLSWPLRRVAGAGTLVGLLATLNLIPVSAEESTTRDLSRIDCRYEGGGTVRSGNAGSAAIELFPENDVFRPLLADPKQPQFFAAWEATWVRTNNTYVNIGSVGFGENIGLVGRRNGCNGWQVGILAGVFAQFDLDSASDDLINADYVVGVPVSWRSGLFSTRVRLYHQSSHLGDEFLLGNPGFPRVNLSFEALEAVVSLDTPAGWGRVYVGGSYLVDRDPETLDRTGVQWGFELRGPSIAAPISQLPRLRLTPVFGADFKSFEELDWTINTNVVAGLEFSNAGADRRFRLLLNYYHGFNPYGQFFAQKIEMVGVGLYLSF